MRHVVLGFICLAAVLAYVQRMALGVPSKTIEADLGISESQMGLVMGAWYWAYALLQIPAGLLTDRIGSRRALIFFVFTWSLLTGLAGLATNLGMLLLFWSMMGLAQTGLVPGMARGISSWYPPTGRAFGTGLVAASMALGAALAPFLAGQLLRWFTWQQMLGLYVLPGLLWTLAFAVVVPERRDAAVQIGRFGETMGILVRSVPMQLLCTQQFLRAAAMAFFFTWFPRFLQETRGLNKQDSGTLSAWPGVAAMLGGILGGLVSDWILRRTGNRRWSRQGVAVVGMVLCSLLALSAHFVTDVHTAVLLISLGAFWGTCGGVSGYAICIDLGGNRVGTMISVMNMCGNIGAGIFAFAVGRYVAWSNNWDAVLLMFSAIFLVDALCWALLNPKRPIFDDDTPAA